MIELYPQRVFSIRGQLTDVVRAQSIVSAKQAELIEKEKDPVRDRILCVSCAFSPKLVSNRCTVLASSMVDSEFEIQHALALFSPVLKSPMQDLHLVIFCIFVLFASVYRQAIKITPFCFVLDAILIFILKNFGCR